MSSKKSNVLTKLIYIFCPKKCPSDNIVDAADRIIENYIASKNKLIHRKCTQNRDKTAGRILLGFIGFLAFAYIAHIIL